MTEAEWHAQDKLWPMCHFLRGRSTDRKLRLLACAYCRSIWGLMGRASRRAIILGERMADGSVCEIEREAVVRAAIQAVLRYPSMIGDHYMAADRAYRADGAYWADGHGRHVRLLHAGRERRPLPRPG